MFCILWITGWMILMVVALVQDVDRNSKTEWMNRRLLNRKWRTSLQKAHHCSTIFTLRTSLFKFSCYKPNKNWKSVKFRIHTNTHTQYSRTYIYMSMIICSGNGKTTARKSEVNLALVTTNFHSIYRKKTLPIQSRKCHDHFRRFYLSFISVSIFAQNIVENSNLFWM